MSESDQTADETTDDAQTKNTLRKARRAMQNPREMLNSRPVRQSVAMVVGANMAVGVAAAQTQAASAGDMLCGTGIGNLLGLGLGAVSMGLVLMAVYRGSTAWTKLGSARSDQKQKGREQAKGAGITFAGAFFPAVAGVILDKAGIGAFSCIDFGSIVGGAAVAVPMFPF